MYCIYYSYSSCRRQALSIRAWSKPHIAAVINGNRREAVDSQTTKCTMFSAQAAKFRPERFACAHKHHRVTQMRRLRPPSILLPQSEEKLLMAKLGAVNFRRIRRRHGWIQQSRLAADCVYRVACDDFLPSPRPSRIPTPPWTHIYYCICETFCTWRKRKCTYIRRPTIERRNTTGAYREASL